VATPDLTIALFLGALAGVVAGEASRALAVKGHPARRPDRLSWILAGVGALALAAHPAARGGLWLAGAEAALIALLLLVVASDLRERAVYPAIVLPGAAIAAAMAPLLGTSIVDALLGAAASAGVFAALYAFARVRFGPGTLGSGDVSAAALLGAVTGLSRLFLALTLVGLIGGGVALVVWLRARSLRATFPYAPALCLSAMLATVLRAP
jgi:prepilin signal peptidase PulO-like enzyme (type II secretory pathway)